MPLPILTRWKRDEQVAALRIVLGSVLSGLKHQLSLNEFVDWTLLQNRYKHIPPFHDQTDSMLRYVLFAYVSACEC
jgi:hypothetical protein